MKNVFTKKSIRVLTLTLCLALISPSLVLAQKGGGYSGPSAHSGPPPSHEKSQGPAVRSIGDVHKLKDDSWVTLRGRIIRHEGGKIYIFQDAGGKGKIEIDKKAWDGAHVGPNDRVELLAKIDKKRDRIEIEVERVRKIK